MKAWDCQQRLAVLEIMKTAIVTIKQQLIFTLASPEELIQIIMEDERFKKCEILLDVNFLSIKYGFEKGWKEAISKNNLLNVIEIDILKSVADILGKSDLETQIKQLELAIEQLTAIITEHKIKINDNKKLYLSLGFLSSIAFAVMLV